MKKQHVPIETGIDEDGLFKGCHTYGTTMDEAMEQIRDVIGLCLEETGAED